MSALSGRVHYDPIVVSGERTVVAECFAESAEAAAKPECSRARLEVRGSRCGSLSDEVAVPRNLVSTTRVRMGVVASAA